MKDYLLYKDNAFYNPNTKEKLCETQKEATKYLLKNKNEQKKLSVTPKKHLNYLVCKNCGELSSIKQELKAIETLGSQGMCYCLGNRTFLPFYKINKELFLILQCYNKADRISLLKDLDLKSWN
jgi:hypothetical protein